MPRPWRHVLIGLSLCGTMRPCLAALGADESSVAVERQQMHASVRRLLASGYTVQELQSPNGTIVREFVTSAGIVFAVSWQGPMKPDLRQTLGAYFQSYQTAPRTQTSQRLLMSIEQSDLVVHSAGHGRAFFGQAYVPQLLPPGVTTDELH